MAEAAGQIPAPQRVPVGLQKVLPVERRPGDEMTAVIGGQEDAVGLVVRCGDHAGDGGHVVLPQVLSEDPQDQAHLGQERQGGEDARAEARQRRTRGSATP
jgi:hypothetical protein